MAKWRKIDKIDVKINNLILVENGLFLNITDLIRIFL